jgi:MFS family permease
MRRLLKCGGFLGRVFGTLRKYPSRLDQLPWSRWHLRIVVALSITWLLDGLEGSSGGCLAGVLKSQSGLGLSDVQLGLSSSFYLGGAVVGALVFGFLADHYGRRRLFVWTLPLYICSTAATGLSWNLSSFTICRVLTGAGIGGEYAAVNSAVDELIPARIRGRTDLWINATFWLGIILGSGLSVILLAPSCLGQSLGWRVAFFSGVPIGVLALILRRYIPESPRWLISQGRHDEAESVLGQAESHSPILPYATDFSDTEWSWLSVTTIAKFLLGNYRQRALVCMTLRAAQAFFYNSVFFSLAFVLSNTTLIRTEQR